MVTSPSEPTFTEPNGKENYFAHDINEPKTKAEKKKKSKGKEPSAPTGVPTDAEFERMLVRVEPRNDCGQIHGACMETCMYRFLQRLLLPPHGGPLLSTTDRLTGRTSCVITTNTSHACCA